MSAPFLLDLSHTSHTRARTGIQRVARSLWREWSASAAPITYDPHQRTWRPLDPWELKNLATHSFGSKRSTSWPLIARLRGHTRRLLGHSSPLTHFSSLNPSGILMPEVFSPAVGAALPALFAATTGPRAAIFHDAIALKFPELTPSKTVARFPVYLRELLAFDGIAAISDDSRASLLDYWQWLGVPAAAQPIVTTIPLGIDLPSAAPNSASGSQLSTLSSQLSVSHSQLPPPIILSVGSIEGRKNHLALLDACESLWTAGTRFELHVIGLSHPQTGRAALARLHALQAAGRPIRYAGPASDADLATAYATCAFTVYPSIIEGFGLPVLESLSRGKPCVCSARGALGESARGGGCVMLDRVDSPALAASVSRLLSTPAELTALATAARARRFRTWSDYARDLSAWLATVPRRPTP